MKITKKPLVLALIMLLGGIAAEWAIAHALSWGAKQAFIASKGPDSSPFLVDAVVDGDTIVVRHRTAQPITVRALGIDTPETRDPRGPVQCYGPEAAAYAVRTLAGQRVVLSYDTTAGRLDKYGRTLAYIWLGHQLYNQEAVRLGFAHEYTYDQHHPYQRHAAFTAAEADARTHHRGMWAADTCNGDTRQPADNTATKTLPPANQSR
jgi:micrococcal nuclease